VSAELAIVLLSLALSIGTMGVVLTLLLRKRLDYPTLAEHDKLEAYVTDELARLGLRMSQLYRVVEVIDEHTGANGHRVLHRKVRTDDTKTRKR
jgi:hypothetical protein